MPTTSYYTLTTDGLQETVNAASEVLIESLVGENIITKEQANKYFSSYMLVAIEPKSITARLRSLFGVKEKDTGCHFRLVKVADFLLKKNKIND